jgi:hypothetical protein
MDDIAVSLYVLLGAALLAAAVFLLTRRAAKRREEALFAYCTQNGYHLTILREPSAREIRIEGDGWQLVSRMRALQNSADSGSSSWRRETEWLCERENPLRQTFALQMVQGASDLDRLPPWMREAALGALRLWLGEEMDRLTSVRSAFYESGRTCLVFETEAPAADAALEKLLISLHSYRGNLPLYLTSTPAHIRLQLPDAAISTAQEAEQLLTLAKTLQ